MHPRVVAKENAPEEAATQLDAEKVERQESPNGEDAFSVAVDQGPSRVSSAMAGGRSSVLWTIMFGRPKEGAGAEEYDSLKPEQRQTSLKENQQRRSWLSRRRLSFPP